MVRVIATKKDTKAKPIISDIVLNNPYLKAKTTLLCAIAVPYRCQVIVAGKRTAKIVGFPADIEAVKLLFASLQLQATSASLVERDRYGFTTPGESKGFTHAFILGFSSRVYKRLLEKMAETVTSSGTSTDLVLRDRNAEVSAFVGDQFPSLRSSQGARTANGAGYFSGNYAGGKANLSTGSNSVGRNTRELV